MLGNKIKLHTLTYIATILTTLVVVSLLVFNVQSSAAHKFYHDVIDWSLVPSSQVVVVKAGSNETVPVSLIAPQNETLSLKLGVTTPANAGIYEHTGIDKLPFGITAKLDKQNIILPSESMAGKAIRDKLDLSIVVSQEANPGKYLTCLLAYEDNGKYSCEGLYVVVEK